MRMKKAKNDWHTTYIAQIDRFPFLLNSANFVDTNLIKQSHHRKFGQGFHLQIIRHYVRSPFHSNIWWEYKTQVEEHSILTQRTGIATDIGHVIMTFTLTEFPVFWWLNVWQLERKSSTTRGVHFWPQERLLHLRFKVSTI